MIGFALECRQYVDGWGRHEFYLNQTTEGRAGLTESAKLSYFDQVLLMLSGFFIKAAIGVFLLRVFGTKRRWHWIIWSIIGLVGIATILLAVTTLAQCAPINKIWDRHVPGKCVNPDLLVQLGYFHGGMTSLSAASAFLSDFEVAVSAFSDWALASLPIYFLWKMQMAKWDKIGISFLMSLGYV